MKYVERNPLKLEAYKFEGKITPELQALGIVAPNSFQVNMQCPECKSNLRDHGLIGIGQNFKIICPNTYIIYNANNQMQLMSAENFEALYRPLDIEDAKFVEISK